MFTSLEPFRGRLLVACSGGADSTCLAHACMERARREQSEAPYVVYVDHGLRPESAQEAQSVVDFATRFGGHGLVRHVHLKPGASLEAEARRVRYEALATLADELEIDWVLLGHTRSDQAETVFMRILRGTGLVGLAGMSSRRGRYARPLLQHSRAETEAYCRDHDLDAVEDPMNRDLGFTRARIRHRWLPELREENSQIDAALCRLADSARDHREVLDWAAAQVLQTRVDTQGQLCVASEFAEVPESLAIQVLARHAAQFGVCALEARHLRGMLALALAPADGTKTLDLPGATLYRRYDAISYAVRPEAGAAATAGTAPMSIHLGVWCETPDQQRRRRVTRALATQALGIGCQTLFDTRFLV